MVGEAQVTKAERALVRRVGQAIGRYGMIRDGDRVAVAVSGGKDSLSLLEALRILQRRAPVKFWLCAFTIEQGKFLRSIEPLAEYLEKKGIPWVAFYDLPSRRLLEAVPDHGCDLCSRYRRRALYEVAAALGVNVIALGHTADDFCEALLRNALFIGRLVALPPVAYSRGGDFRLIRPLVFVPETLTSEFVKAIGAPVVPCGCSQKTGTIRQAVRAIIAQLEKDFPLVKHNLLTAMSRVELHRLLDPRYLSGLAGEGAAEDETETAVPQAGSTPALREF